MSENNITYQYQIRVVRTPEADALE